MQPNSKCSQRGELALVLDGNVTTIVCTMQVTVLVS